MQNRFQLPQHLTLNVLERLQKVARHYTHYADDIYIAKVSENEVFLNYDAEDSSTVDIAVTYGANNADVHSANVTKLTVRSDKCGVSESMSTAYSGISRNDIKHVFETHIPGCQPVKFGNLASVLHNSRNYSDIIDGTEFKTLRVYTSLRLIYGLPFDVVDNQFFFTRAIPDVKDKVDVFTLDDFLNGVAYHMIEEGWLYRHVKYELERFYRGLTAYFYTQNQITGLDAKEFFDKLDVYVKEEETEINKALYNEV